MRVPTGILPSLKVPTHLEPQTPAAATLRPTAPAFGCVKVRSMPDLVLASLAGVAFGLPHDLSMAIRGGPFPTEGRHVGRRAILYRLERDGWTTIIREGDGHTEFDPVLARRLSRALGVRAFAFFLDPKESDLAYEVFERGVSVASYVQVGSEAPDAEGVIDPGLAALDPVAHGRGFLRREDATYDRLSFRHFELPGLLRGRWDLHFDRAILLPDVPPVEDLPEPARPRAQAPAAAEPRRSGMSREGEHAVHVFLRGVVNGLVSDTPASGTQRRS